MELYLSVLNMRVFENVDMITVPDLGVLQMTQCQGSCGAEQQ